MPLTNYVIDTIEKEIAGFGFSELDAIIDFKSKTTSENFIIKLNVIVTNGVQMGYNDPKIIKKQTCFLWNLNAFDNDQIISLELDDLLEFLNCKKTSNSQLLYPIFLDDHDIKMVRYRAHQHHLKYQK